MGTFLRWLGYMLAAVLVIVLACNSYTHIAGSHLIVDSIEGLEQSDAILVLGASVYGDGSLSPVFKERVDTAVMLYRAGVAPKILVSGDNRDVMYNEVTPVLIYLTETHQVPSEDVFLDYAGLDTYDSMYRARHVFQANSLVVVTQWFHLRRALFLANVFGITAQGFEASGGTKADARLWLRERLATVKAVAEAITKREAAYTGEPIPIMGDGRKSWVED